MNYGEIKKVDIANGIGVRVSLFVSGCTHRCKGCFNPETWNFDFGQPFTKQTEDELIKALTPDYIDGISILGGEPFEPSNQKALLPFLQRLKNELPDKTVWFYSGYLFEELTCQKESRAFTDITLEILSLTDVLVDGEFVEDLKDISLRFKGSSNQRIIDVKKSLETKSPVLLELN